MRIQQIDSLEDTPGLHWNRLVNGNPFLRHEFLLALEQNNCVGEEFGWHSRHLLLHDNQNRLRGAIPLYLKTNSYGELVFDWSWADAYQRAGLAYYPKLVSAIPYTPATGPRLLTQSDDSAVIGAALIQAARNLIATEHCSSLHWLFPHSDDCARLECEGFMKREDIQFHWSNQGYQNFDDFLSRLSAKRRKEIRRERRLVAEAGISFKSLIGADACDEDWQAINDFYQRTFDEKWGVPTLNLGFFRQIGAQMGEQILLIFAYRNKRRIAGALCFFSDKVLYGRHWGAIEHHRGSISKPATTRE